MHGEGPDVTPVKVLNCDTISQVGVCFSVFRALFTAVCSRGEDFITLGP